MISVLLISVGAHPGVTYTDLQRHMDKDVKGKALKQFKEVMEPWQGALPALYTATASEVKGEIIMVRMGKMKYLVTQRLL